MSKGSERLGGFGLSVVAVVAATALASAQSVDLERRAYARFEELRTDLLRLCLTAPAARRSAVAELLADDGIRHPFETMAAARAAVLDVEDDDLLRYRTGTMALALPGVIDQQRFHQVHITAHAPRIVPDLASVRFDVWIEDPSGQRLRELSITEPTGLQDVLRVRATDWLPTGGLLDGPHVVGMEAWIGDQGPRPQDPVVRVPFEILPEFAERAERLPLSRPATPEAGQQAQARLAGIPLDRRTPEALAVLAGATERVERVYAGRPRLPAAGPTQLLGNAETILGNLLGDRDLLAGLSGPVTIGLTAAARNGEATVLSAALEVPAEDGRAVHRPLVVFLPGAPTWDARATRPQTPDALAPEWLLERLRIAGFDREGELQAVVLESPGRIPYSGELLTRLTRDLQRLLSWTAGQPVVWVAEREGCFAAQRGLQAPPQGLRGVVFVAGAGPTATQVEDLEDLRLLAVPAQGHSSTKFLQHVAGAVADEERYACTEPNGIAWPLAIPLRAGAIESFVRELSGK